MLATATMTLTKHDTSGYGVRFSAMASSCEIRLAAENEQQASTLAQMAIEEVRRIELKYSRYRPESLVSRINAQAGGTALAIDAETHALFDYAATLYASSGGLFDITSGVLRRAWDFRCARLPSEEQLQPLLALIGWHRVERCQIQNTPHIRLPSIGMEIDFGGFGKEYAADRAASMLAAAGVIHAYVNLGGDIRILGPQADGRPWQIGIQHPRLNDSTIASLPISSGALASSGDYERFIEVNGQRHCHILHPQTGHSVKYWQAVSVLAPVTIAAGSYATIAMLKEAAGLEFLQQSGLAFCAIDLHGQVHQQAPDGSS